VQPPEGDAVAVDCTAQDTVVGGSKSTCEAVGFEDLSTASPADGRGPSPLVRGITPGAEDGKQVTGFQRHKLKRVVNAGQSVRKTVLRLKLNRRGKRLLKSRGVLNVRVHVTLHHGTSVQRLLKLIQFRR
jgi:hypothetical protein